MLRSTLRKCYSKGMMAPCPNRNQSTSSSKSSSAVGKVALFAVIGGATVSGATLAYAKQNSQFRSRLEDTIPYSSPVLKTLIGPAKPDLPPSRTKPPTSSTVKKDDSQPSLLNKKLERETPSESISTKLPPIPTPVLEVSSESKEKESGKDTTPERPPETVNSKSGLSPEWGKRSTSTTQTQTTPVTTPKDTSVDINKLPPEVQEALVQQLKHQLSAFNDYLKEQLQLQSDELSRIHYVGLEERVLEEKLKYQRELASSIVRLQEVENLLAERNRLDHQERNLKQIWFLCQQLNESLKSNPAEGITGEPRTIITTEVLPVLKKLIQDEETTPIVKLAVQSIHDNQEVKNRGVFTEDALISRFDKVDRICRRLSLIPEEGGTLWQYALSYAQSVFILDAKEIPKAELDNEPVDISHLDTFALLTRIRHHLKNRNLEMSLRYANQLKGESRKAAADWIKDVRTHLEVRQVTSLLQTYASSVSLKTFDSGR